MRTKFILRAHFPYFFVKKQAPHFFVKKWAKKLLSLGSVVNALFSSFCRDRRPDCPLYFFEKSGKKLLSLV